MVTPSQDTPAPAAGALEGKDIHAIAARRGPRVRRRVGIAAIGACVAAACAMTIANVNASTRPVKRDNQVSAQELQREMRRFRAEGFVAASCPVRGTVTTNFTTHRLLLVSG